MAKGTKIRGKGSRRIVFCWALLLVVLASIWAVPAKVRAAHAVDAQSTGGSGWLGEYYGNRNLSYSPAMVRYDAAVDFDWGYAAPAAGMAADGFSARWTRSLYFEGGTYRFFALSDDGVRVWLDGEVIIDQWHPAPGVTYTADRTLSAGTHRIRVEYYEENGGARIEFWWEAISTEHYAHWKGEYYANSSLDSRPVLVRDDEAIDFAWGGRSPAEGVPEDDFSIRWTREVYFETSAIYRFHVIVYGDVCLWVDGDLVLSVRGYGSDREFSAVYALSRGEHEVKVEYFEGGGSARIQVWWEIAGSVYTDWQGEYYPNRYLKGDPTLVRYDPAPVFDWGEGGPADGFRTDGFSVRWSHVEDFQAGTFEFHVWADDGIRIYVDGELVLDEWHDNSGGEEEYVVSLYLAGEHEVMAEYYEHKGEAMITFWWVRVSD